MVVDSNSLVKDSNNKVQVAVVHPSAMSRLKSVLWMALLLHQELHREAIPHTDFLSKAAHHRKDPMLVVSLVVLLVLLESW